MFFPDWCMLLDSGGSGKGIERDGVGEDWAGAVATTRVARTDGGASFWEVEAASRSGVFRDRKAGVDPPYWRGGGAEG